MIVIKINTKSSKKYKVACKSCGAGLNYSLKSGWHHKHSDCKGKPPEVITPLPLYGTIRVNGYTPKTVSLGEKFRPDLMYKNRAIGNSADAKNLNKFLDEWERKIELAIKKLKTENKEATPDAICGLISNTIEVNGNIYLSDSEDGVATTLNQVINEWIAIRNLKAQPQVNMLELLLQHMQIFLYWYNNGQDATAMERGILNRDELKGMDVPLTVFENIIMMGLLRDRYWIETHNLRNNTNPLSEATIWAMYLRIKMLIGYAHSEGYMRKNIFRNKFKIQYECKPNKDVISDDQIREFYGYNYYKLTKPQQRAYWLMIFLMETGMQAADLAIWSQIKILNRISDNAKVLIGPRGKTDMTRALVLSPKALEAMEHLEDSFYSPENFGNKKSSALRDHIVSATKPILGLEYKPQRIARNTFSNIWRRARLSAVEKNCFMGHTQNSTTSGKHYDIITIEDVADIRPTSLLDIIDGKYPFVSKSDDRRLSQRAM